MCSSQCPAPITKQTLVSTIAPIDDNAKDLASSTLPRRVYISLAFYTTKQGIVDCTSKQGRRRAVLELDLYYVAIHRSETRPDHLDISHVSREGVGNHTPETYQGSVSCGLRDRFLPMTHDVQRT